MIERDSIVGVYPVRSKPAGAGRQSLGVLIILIPMLLIGLLVWWMFRSRVKGGWTLTVPDHTWTMKANHCYSGERRGFYGIEFFDSKQPGTGGRVASPEDGETHIALNVPSADYAVKYRKRDCKVWDVDLHKSGSRYNGIRAMDGHIKFDCSTGDDTASHAVGDLQFGSCH